MSSNHIIRYATEQDVGSILYLIKELADFENALDAVQATEQHLLQTLSFPTTPNATALSDFSPGFARTLLIIVPPNQTTTASTDGSSSSEPAAAAAAAAAHDGTVAGMALFFTNYSTWRGAPGIHLEDLYVRPAHRRRGYARALLRALGRETLRMGGRRLEWSCLKWNETALAFYEGLGAQRQDEWVGLRVEGEALQRLGAE